MSWKTVARAELVEADSWGIRIGTLLLAIATVVAAAQSPQTQFVDSQLSAGTLAVLDSTIDSRSGLFAVLGMLFGYWSVFGVGGSADIEEVRELPDSSTAVVGGKFLGQLALLAGIVLVNYLTAGVVVWIVHGSFSLHVFVLTMGVTVLAAAVHVAIGMGTSLVVQSRPYAFAALFAVASWYLFFGGITVFLLQQLAVELGYAAAGYPGWLASISLVQPTVAIAFTRQLFVPETAGLESSFDPGLALMLAGVVVTICWLGLPLWGGYRRFERARAN